MKFTEEQIIKYSKPISDTEENKCKNAINMISNALKNMGYIEKEKIQLAYMDTFAYETTLQKNNRKIKLLIQGSYANNTNVRAESDVDIAVIQEDVFISNYRTGVVNSDYKFCNSDYTFIEYKRDIYNSLVNQFGTDNVKWKSKCLFVNGNSYRVDSDTVPARRNRDYRNDFTYNPMNYIGGISIISDEGETFVNYPEQHIKNGRDKNKSTNLYYKKMVRIIKKIRYIMIDNHISSASKINSFMLESLLWNIPDYKYINDLKYTGKFQGIINYLKYISIKNISSYKEANGIKKLCETKEKEQNLVDFIEELDTFFEY